MDTSKVSHSKHVTLWIKGVHLIAFLLFSAILIWFSTNVEDKLGSIVDDNNLLKTYKSSLYVIFSYSYTGAIIFELSI